MSSQHNEDVAEKQTLMTGKTKVLESRRAKRRPLRYAKQELAVIPDEKNWKGIFLSALVIIIVCVLVGVSAWLLQPTEDAGNYQFGYDIDAMFDMKWIPYTTSGEWIGESFVYSDRHRNIVKRTGEELEILVTNETMESLGISKANVSPDFKYALLSYSTQKIFRHSTTAQYYIYTIATGSHVSLHTGALRYASWGTQDNQLTYVSDFDLYYKSDVHALPKQITDTGKNTEAKISNGITDWIYEEEMFTSTVAHWISKDGSYLAYITFNDTLVPQVDIVLYNMPYPEVEKINYPKVDYPNPTVQLHVQDLKTNHKLKIEIPELVKTKEPLINSFVWASDSSALITWSNRYQNITVTSLCSVTTKEKTVMSCRVVREKYADGWVEYIGRAPVPGEEGTYFQIDERSMGGRGKFHHLLMVDYSSDQNSSRFLTYGNWEVTRILGYQKENHRIYYISTQLSPMDRHMYSVDTREERPTPICHTCFDTGDDLCRYADVDISDHATWAMLQCKGPGVPYSALIDLHQEETISIESNPELKEKIRNTQMPEVVFETITIKGENGEYDFQAKLFLPPNAKLKKNIPLFVDIYAGPGSQKVNSKFLLDWTTYLVTNKSIAVLTFDGRGSGFRGSNVLKEVNRRLGKYEIEDQITAIKETLARHHYLSPTKIGVGGWSYGGYASAMLATHPTSLAQNLAKCVISIAPVTEWLLYDSIYTERYMGSPKTNFNGYRESSLLHRAESFKNFKYLLIHGTKDDNVHFQNSAVLETELVRAGIVHRYQVYTDETHSLSSGSKYTLRHLFKLMDEFLTECYDTA